MTDEQLVARLKANDDRAYQELVARYGDRLYGYVFSITGDQQLSEDVVSDTYLRVVEGIDDYVYSGIPFKAWLYRIAHNLTINALRRASAGARANARSFDNPEPDDPASVVQSRLEAEAVRKALTELTEDQQNVILLRFVADQSYNDVARILAKTESAVKQLQLRALRALGRAMRHKDE